MNRYSSLPVADQLSIARKLRGIHPISFADFRTLATVGQLTRRYGVSVHSLWRVAKLTAPASKLFAPTGGV